MRQIWQKPPDPPVILSNLQEPIFGAKRHPDVSDEASGEKGHLLAGAPFRKLWRA